MANPQTRQSGRSPAYYARQRFLRNKPAVAGLAYIVFLTLVAIAGPLILPDNTPQANDMILELETQPPGFTTQLLYVRKNQSMPSTAWWERWAFGTPSPFEKIPFIRYRMGHDSIAVERFIGNDTAGVWESFFLPDVVYAVHPEDPRWEVSPDGVRFQDVDGRRVEASWAELRHRVEADHLVRRTYWLGTDRFGRDMLSRLALGARVSLSVGLIAVVISLVLGIFIGAVGGFYRGWIDEVVVWLINVAWSIPTLLLVIAISIALGKGFWQVFVAVGLTMWVSVARIVRGQVLSVREQEFITASRALGFRFPRILLFHILPNIVGPLIVIAAANFATAILLEAGLSFLGIGVQPPTPSWGYMLNDHRGYIVVDAAYLAFLPGLAIMLAVLAFYLVGNGLRDALDVKMK